MDDNLWKLHPWSSLHKMRWMSRSSLQFGESLLLGNFIIYITLCRGSGILGLGNFLRLVSYLLPEWSGKCFNAEEIAGLIYIYMYMCMLRTPRENIVIKGGEAISRKTWVHNSERYLARGTRWITHCLVPKTNQNQKVKNSYFAAVFRVGVGKYWQVNRIEKDAVIVDSLIQKME